MPRQKPRTRRARDFLDGEQGGIGRSQEPASQPAERLTGNVKLTFGARTDVGRARAGKPNEDNLYVPQGSGLNHPKGQLFVVADGVGGNAFGGRASGLAVSVIPDTFYSDGTPDIQTSLTNAIQQANRTIYTESRGSGMGTTLVAAAVRGNQAYIAWEGDSRAYLVRGGNITQLTEDHSFVDGLVRAGTLTAQQAKNHPMRNVITRSLGNKPEVSPDLKRVQLQPGDKLLLCTDGLSNSPVYDGDLQKIVAGNRNPQAAADQCVALANQRGGGDNITAVVVEYGGRGVGAKSGMWETLMGWKADMTVPEQAVMAAARAGLGAAAGSPGGEMGMLMGGLAAAAIPFAFKK